MFSRLMRSCASSASTLRTCNIYVQNLNFAYHEHLSHQSFYLNLGCNLLNLSLSFKQRGSKDYIHMFRNKMSSNCHKGVRQFITFHYNLFTCLPISCAVEIVAMKAQCKSCHESIEKMHICYSTFVQEGQQPKMFEILAHLLCDYQTFLYYLDLFSLTLK